MTVEEVFGQITTRQINGFMMHEQLADYYDFLGLKGCKRCHEYHYYEESASFRRISRYYINHYNRLLMEMPVQNKNVIPPAWRSHVRQDVDSSTKRAAVKEALEKWVSWETETKHHYEMMYSELLKMDQIAAAEEVMCLIKDVDKELKVAQRKHLERKADDYDMKNIIDEQQRIHDKYVKKIRKMSMV